MQPLPAKITRKALLALPSRDWSKVSVYDSLFIFPTGRKHDSGYMLIAIAGVLTTAPGPQVAEIAAMCDDVCWNFPKSHPYDIIRPDVHRMMLRTDCLYPSGILHFWGSGESQWRARFKVGASLSSTDITLTIEARNPNG